MKDDINAKDDELETSIAIIGMSGRFPGANNVEAFWRNLCDGVESITFFDDDELEDDFSDEVRKAKNFVKARPILDNVDQFDAEFFDMYAKEAALTDPQQRLFLECAWEAIEESGYDHQRIDGDVGVFGGSSLNTYLLRHIGKDSATLKEFTSSFQVGCYPTLVGNAPDFVATRVSYKMNLKGPSVNVQSACSTSLLAVAQAYQSLQLYQCDMAVAGGVSITFPQKRGFLAQEGGMVSEDGHCRSFDAEAAGTIFGSGAGCVLLKRYTEAVEDGDHIYAIIRGCGVNNDGADKVGFTAPSVDGQADAISAAIEEAGVSARSISYVECHGTATPLGDPIEIAGLTKAYRNDTDDSQYCAIGSAKTNVGHLDAAAGVTGLIKTAMSLKHATLPATLHYQAPNPRIEFDKTPFFVNKDLTPWAASNTPRRAGVSSFGVGGTNVHLVVEEAPEQETTADTDGTAYLLPLSARTPAALAEAKQNLAEHLSANPKQSLADISYTLTMGRRGFAQRDSIVATSHEEAIKALTDNPTRATKATESPSDVVFLLPGQGSQYPEMGKELYLKEPVFRQHIDECASILEPLLGEDIRHIIYPDEQTSNDAAAERLMTTTMAQPAIFCIEYALAKLWMSHSIQPVAMIGHSVGEWVAAVLSEVLTLNDALTLVAERGRLMGKMERGSMLSVRLSEQEVTPFLSPTLALAAVNSPKLCVVSGDFDSIGKLEEELSAKDIIHRRLHTSHAFHSHMMDDIVEPLLNTVKQATLSAPRIPILSCVSGEYLTTEQATSAQYWADHVRKPVRFSDGIQRLAQDHNNATLLEVGPGNVLTTLSLQSLRDSTHTAIASLPSPNSLEAGSNQVLSTLGELWSANAYPLDWPELYKTEGRRVSLPTYPFQRKQHWIAAPEQQQAVGASAAAGSLANALSDLGEDTSPEASATQTSNDSRSRLIAILEDLSGESLDHCNDDTTFLQMGFDSLFLSQVAQQINNVFKVKVTFRQLLGEYADLGSLSGFLNQHNTSSADNSSADTANTSPTVDEESAKPSRFDVYKRKEQNCDVVLDKRFSDYIDDLSARCDVKMQGSKGKTKADRPILADPRAASGFRNEWKSLVYPLVVDRCAGSKLWDIDGNEYIDLVNGYGQTFFGHSPDFVVDALKNQLDKGFAIGPQAEYAGEVAELFAELTGNQRVTFCNTGSEAVMAAMRVARTVTGRNKVVVFNGDYHGQFDEVLVKGVGKKDNPRSQPIAGGIPREAVSNMVVLEYGTSESLLWINEHRDDIAAVVVEPVQSRNPALQPFKFLKELRIITETCGSALVFDEVVTGFRTHPGGIQAITGIRADLATYGKVVGGGLPVGILAGKADFMDALDGGQWQYGDDSFPEVGVTFFAGTFVRHPLALAATRAVLQHLKTHGPELQQQVTQRTTALVSELNTLFASFNLSARIDSFASFFYFNLHQEHDLAGLLYYQLREHGIHIQDGFPCFLTTAHSDDDIAAIIQAFRDSLTALAGAGILGNQGDEKSTEQASTKLTESQMEIWLAAQMGDEASCVFNESITLGFEGELDSDAMQSAIEKLVARHDSLRVQFDVTGETLSVNDNARFDWQTTQYGDDDNAAILAQIIQRDAAKPFDLVNGPLLRTHLAQFHDNRSALVVTTHHIVCDGWSINIMVNELAVLYAAELRGGMAMLPKPMSFVQYAAQENTKTVEQQDTIYSYWSKQFHDLPEPLVLPSDHPRSAKTSYQGHALSRQIDVETYQALKQQGAQHGSTLFVTLLSAFQIMLGRLSQQNDIVVGVPTAGQAQLEDEILVGHCVHFLPIRGAWDEQTTLIELLQLIAKQVLDAYEHQGTTLGELVRRLDVPRVAGQVPLTQVQFNLERLDDNQDWPNLKTSVVPNEKAYVNFDLFVNVIESDNGLRIDCDYNSEIYDQSSIQHWLDIYHTVLMSLLDDPQQKVATLNWLPADYLASLTQFNETQRKQPNTLLNDYLLNNCTTHGDKVAVSYLGKDTSYSQLAAQTNQLAHYIRLHVDIQAGAKIAVCVTRSANTLVAMLATLESGAAYIPLDPSHPAERLQKIIQSANVSAVICDTEAVENLVDGNTPVVQLQTHQQAIESMDSARVQPERSLDDIAYVIYTSGSTGQPKGVEISHRSAVNFLHSMANKPGMASDDCLLAITTVTFDISVLELFLPLSLGAHVVIADDDALADGFKLKQLVKDHQVSIMQGTPANWQIMLDAEFAAPANFRALVGGEAINPALVKRLVASGAAVWNMYGPTETTVWSACQQLADDDQAITIGTPIDNTQLYVLDKHLQTTAQGMPGQLYIGGVGLAKGYLNQPELTSKSFIHSDEHGGRIYLSGDNARTTASGSIEIIGRQDHQIKLRGFRIELSEIEHAILKQTDVSEAVVTLREDQPGVRRLVAYIVVEGESAENISRLSSALQTLLPEYMQPSAWVPLAALPRLSNGKLARQQLPKPNSQADAIKPYVAPQNDKESLLCNIWSEVLDIPQISRDDDLFLIGADSIQVFQMVARASKQGLSLSAKIMMDGRTPAGVAALMADAKPKKSRMGRIKKVHPRGTQ